jgi:ankyrin repeat protein
MDSAETLLCRAVEDADVFAIQTLVKHGADINGRGADDDEPPLSVAASTQRHDIATLLLAMNADVNVKDGYDSTPLHNAITYYNGDIQMIRLLISAGANVNAMDCRGHTPVSEAAYAGCLPPLRELLMAGACPLGSDNRGLTALHWSVLSPSHAYCISETLLEAGADACAVDKRGLWAESAVISRTRKLQKRWSKLRQSWLASCTFYK